MADEQPANTPTAAPDAPLAETPAQTPTQTPGIDARRLLMVTLLVAGGLGYFFWDNIRDVIKPPKIIAPAAAPAAAFLPQNEIQVKAGPLDITFTKIGAAITRLTWTDPADGHVETLVSRFDPAHRPELVEGQKDFPNRALVLVLPGHEESMNREFKCTGPKTTDDVTTIEFEQAGFDDGLRVLKTFKVRSDKPVIQLDVELQNPGEPITTRGYALRISDAAGIPSELEKDDCLISIRSDSITDHHRVRQISGAQEWPTEEERRRAAHGHGVAMPTLEWVATANKYFGLIVRPEPPIDGAGLILVRTANCAAAVELRVPKIASGLPNTFHIYAGPKDYNKLSSLPGRQQESIDYWYFGRLATALLDWARNKLVPNYGVAIIIVTIILRLLMWPMTGYNLKSMVNLKKANAELEKIDAREPPRLDRAARTAWVKDARVWENVQRKATIGAFLPMAILLPVLLVLYYTLNAGYEFYRQPFVLWITDISKRDPFFVLPVLMGLAMMGQLRTMSENRKKELSWILMPIAFTVLFAFFSAGLVLFWLVDSLCGWLQLAIIKRRRHLPRMNTDEHGLV